MSPAVRTRWTAVVVLASLWVFFNLLELGAGDGGWPQIVGLPLGIAIVCFGVARLLGWEGVRR